VNEPLFSARQVADYLGVARDTVLDWFEAGLIPGFRLTGRVGSPVRFKPAEIHAWLEEERCGPDVSGPGLAAVSAEA
jgi:excisionase family DNA binding protein